VTFEGLGTVLEVEITLNVTHSFIQDLDAHLISPSGQSVELFTGVGGQYNDLQNLTLADDAARSISTIGIEDQPYTGRWRPEGLLSDFLGEDAAGIWTLVIRDNAFADQGTLNSWSLAITVGESFTTTSEDGSYKFENLPPDEYVIGEVSQLGWVQVPPAETSIPAAVWENAQWTVNVEAFDNPADPVPDSRRNVKNVNFGNQAISLVGDYSANGRVDAADYVIWRKTLDTPVAPPGSGADGNGSGMVDNEDHIAWMTNFGKSLSPGGLAAGASTGGESAGSTSALMVDAGSADVTTAAVSAFASPFDASFVEQEANGSGRIAHRPAARQASFAPSTTSDQALLAWVSDVAEGETPLRNEWSNAETTFEDDGHELDALDSVFAKLGDLLAV
jgi:subtilisin-like proprotein convertase family protein